MDKSVKGVDLSKLVMITMDDKETARCKQYTEDTRWLMRKYDDIRTQYGGEYVAVLHQHIVDHDRDPVRLKKKLKDRSAVIGYVYKEKPLFIL